MKKITFVLMVVMFSFSSCREYTCQCVNTTTGLAGESYSIDAGSSSSAQTKCASHDTATDTCYLSN